MWCCSLTTHETTVKLFNCHKYSIITLVQKFIGTQCENKVDTGEKKSQLYCFRTSSFLLNIQDTMYGTILVLHLDQHTTMQADKMQN